MHATYIIGPSLELFFNSNKDYACRFQPLKLPVNQLQE